MAVVHNRGKFLVDVSRFLVQKEETVVGAYPQVSGTVFGHQIHISREDLFTG